MFELPKPLVDTPVVLTGRPIVKKNNQQVVTRGGKTFKIDTTAYKKWLHHAESEIGAHAHPLLTEPINFPINVQYRFYLPFDYEVDLSNLIEGPQDLLKSAGIIKDDNWHIVASVNGSGVEIDPDNPRTEILITRKCD